MDNSYLLSAAKYVEMNPVAAGVIANPADYPWSSARSHLAAQDDQLVKVEPLLSMIGNWKDFLSLPTEEEIAMFRKHERTGRPLGQSAFVEGLEEHLGRVLFPQKPGPKLNAK
jgi:putative transposase